MSEMNEHADAPAKERSEPKPSNLLVEFAESYGLEAQEMGRTLALTIFPSGKATVAQVHALLLVAKHHGLNPWTKEIYAFPAKGGGIVPIVAVDGWYKMMNDHPQYDGLETVDTVDEEGNLVSVTCRMYRKDRAHPTVVTEYMDECRRKTSPWEQTPRRMLRHRAICQAARVTFSFSGVYDPDEGARFADPAGVPRTMREEPSEQLQKMRAKVREADEEAEDVIDVEVS